MFAHVDSDPCVFCALQSVVGFHFDASSPVLRLDYRPVAAGSVICFYDVRFVAVADSGHPEHRCVAGDYGADHGVATTVESDTLHKSGSKNHYEPDADYLYLYDG